MTESFANWSFRLVPFKTFRCAKIPCFIAQKSGNISIAPTVLLFDANPSVQVGMPMKLCPNAIQNP